MNEAQLKARATKMKNLAKDPNYFKTSYQRRKEKLESGLYYDDRVRVG